MKLYLNQIDPLPPMTGFDMWLEGNVMCHLPLAIRHVEEWQEQKEKDFGTDWRPAGKPDLWVNGKGQMAYRPAEPKDVLKSRALFERGAQLLRDRAIQFGETGVDAALELLDRRYGPDWTTPDGRILKMQEDGWYPHKPGDPMPCDPQQGLIAEDSTGTWWDHAPLAVPWWAEEMNWDTGAESVVRWKPA